MTEINTDTYFRINEIKNYSYCPRTCYYSLCLGIDRTTDLSWAGIDAEQKTKRQMQRRKQALHAVKAGVRHFDVPVVSHQCQLVGRLDEMVEAAEGVYLIDYKDTEQDHGYWKLQLLAYQLCLEEMGKTVCATYIYTIPTRAYHRIQPKRADLERLQAILVAVQRMVTTETCPPPINHIGKCRSCQYSRFCNDIL